MKYTEDEINLIVLSSFTHLSYAARRAILEGFSDPSPRISAALIKRLGDGVYNNVSKKFRDQKYREFCIEELDRRGVECVTIVSEDYPELLKRITDPPLTLFLKGNRQLLNEPKLSIVGSRHTMPSARALCTKFAKTLSGYFAIVSGLADGADSAALEGALENKRAISVLAYGFDFVYPPVNSALKREVEKSGLLVSEYFPTTEVKSYNFPVRNRILAGLSAGTLVVSAAKKSGALITAHCAVESNREVFAFPYSPGVKSGEGCNSLIKEGATLVDSPEDILYSMGITPKSEPKAELSENERLVLDEIAESGEVFLPELAEKLGKLPYELIPTLSALEIKKQIVRLGGNRFAAI